MCLRARSQLVRSIGDQQRTVSSVSANILHRMQHATMRCRAELAPPGASKQLIVKRRAALLSSLAPVVALTSGPRAADARGSAATALVPLADLPMRR